MATDERTQQPICAKVDYCGAERLHIQVQGELLTIKFGPRRSLPVSVGMGAWLFLLAVITSGWTYSLTIGRFGVIVWVLVCAGLFALWTFGVRMFLVNVCHQTGISITPRSISVAAGIRRKRERFNLDPSTPLWIGIPAPEGWQTSYEFWGYGTWYLEARAQGRRAVLLSGISRAEAQLVAAALRGKGMNLEVGSEL